MRGSEFLPSCPSSGKFVEETSRASSFFADWLSSDISGDVLAKNPLIKLQILLYLRTAVLTKKIITRGWSVRLAKTIIWYPDINYLPEEPAWFPGITFPKFLATTSTNVCLDCPLLEYGNPAYYPRMTKQRISQPSRRESLPTLEYYWRIS